MTRTVALNCASCGSNLDIKPEMTTFACGYCGVSQIVERSGGTVSLHLIGETLRNVQVGTDKTAAELALKRLEKELERFQIEYSVLHKKESNEQDSNSKLFGGVWIGLIIICIFIGTRGGVAELRGLWGGCL